MAKELIDLGIPGQPNTGDNLPVGAEKINNFINDVYDTFGRIGVPAEEAKLQATGVYQSVSYHNTNFDEELDRYLYQSKIGEMLTIDMGGAVEIKLPENAWVGSQVKIFRPVWQQGSNTTSVSCSNGTIQNLTEVQIPDGVEYQFIASLDFPNDGDWSQRIVGTKTSSTGLEFESVNEVPVVDDGVYIATIDCSLGKYFTLPLHSNIDAFDFVNVPDSLEAHTIVISIEQEFGQSHTVHLVSLNGLWSIDNSTDNIVDNIGLLSITFLAGKRFITWINSWDTAD